MAAVEANNQKLFEKMAKELSEGAYEVYADCTYKLATWLQNAQAYYPAARAQVSTLFCFRVEDGVTEKRVDSSIATCKIVVFSV
jgi:hypothetical protein